MSRFVSSRVRKGSSCFSQLSYDLVSSFVGRRLNPKWGRTRILGLSILAVEGFYSSLFWLSD